MTAVLFTCAGQRVDIVTAFREAGATTIAVDVDQLAPALYHADRRALVPRVDNFGYVAALRALVELHDVRLIVPLTDLDHLVLAHAHDDLGGAVALVPGPETIERCSDKYLAHCFFEEQRIGSPPTWLPTELPTDIRYPVLVKARKGFGSKHIYCAANHTELEFFLHYTSADSMVQSMCHGEEFSIDVFNDLDGRCLAAVPRTMIESKGGESIKGMTIKDVDLIEFAVRVSEALRIIGPANVQCFREPNGQLQVTDVNPRFGGGFPLPTAAGSRYPELALALANGEKPEPRFGDFREGVVMTRFFSQVILAEVSGALEPVDAPVQAEAVPGGVRKLARLLTGALPFTTALLLAGCGAQHEAAPPTTSVASPPRPVRTVRTVRHEAPAPDVRPRPAVQVTVVDGDTNRRVRGARVTIGRRSARSDRHGVARIPLAHRAPLVTRALKPGYGRRAVRLAFRTHPRSTIRIYRRSLQWTMYGADPGRTQAQGSIRVRPPFRVVWSRGLGTLIEFPAVVADGVAYIANAQGTISALSMRDGKVIWRRSTPHGKMAASPAVWRDQLVVHGMDGHVWVLRRSDGRILWRYSVGSPVESSPVVLDGIDVFGAWNGTIVALDLQTHRVRWRRADGCKVTSSAAFAGSTLYIGDYCGRLLALRASDGRLRWSRGVTGRVYGTPAVAAGRVFVPSSTGRSLTAFSTGGRLLWRRSTGSYVYSSPAVADGRVFFGSYNGVFYALSASSGSTLWAHGTGGPISGAAAVVDGVAYAGSFAHRILGVDARSGRIVLDFPHGEYVPVSGGGDRLLLHGYSRLYGVERR